VSRVGAGDRLRLYQQFRAQYPTASLITELISAEAGQFVLRSQIAVEGTVLATGLATGASLEQAEDRARARALELLGLAVPDQPGTALEVAVQVLTETPEALPPQPTVDSGLTLEAAPVAEPEPTGSEQAVLKPVPETGVPHQPTSQPVPEPATTPEPHLAAVPETIPSDDWSEELAEVEAELKRLEWTPAQEQAHLTQTYGCRSRALITDYSQLMDYLTFLRQQPPPERSKGQTKSVSLPVVSAAESPVSSPMPALDLTTTPPAASPPTGRSPVVDLPRFSTPSPLAQPALSRNEMMDLTSAAVKRLGWTNRQGSEYLRMTYGKTNRQQLTNEELQQFLDYLNQIAPPLDQVPF
jgi:hypothetical protein